MAEYGQSALPARIRPILVAITKATMSLLLLYQGYYIPKFGTIPLVLQALAVLIAVLTVLCILFRPHERKKFNPINLWWTAFGVIAFIVGLTGRYTALVNDSLQTYFSFLIVCFCVGSIDKYENDDWISKTMILVALLCAFSAIFQGYSYQNGGYYAITLGPEDNPNPLQITMNIGIY
ncbi:MAG: hypothetical protein IH607_05950, partial [Firmicutes bacterium]|nr:hypothetical protein [Bacillota bacterium]